MNFLQFSYNSMARKECHDICNFCDTQVFFCLWQLKIYIYTKIRCPVNRCDAVVVNRAVIDKIPKTILQHAQSNFFTIFRGWCHFLFLIGLALFMSISKKAFVVRASGSSSIGHWLPFVKASFHDLFFCINQQTEYSLDIPPGDSNQKLCRL
jgi:hypothetical protein